MKKPPETRPLTQVMVAIVKEFNAYEEEVWNVYLINNKEEEIEGVLVSSNGYGMKGKEKIKTSMLRHFLDEMKPKSYKKIEMITEEVFGLFNQYWVSLFVDKVMYDKKFIFPAESISEDNFTMIPVIEKRGVMIE